MRPSSRTTRHLRLALAALALTSVGVMAKPGWPDGRLPLTEAMGEVTVQLSGSATR